MLGIALRALRARGVQAVTLLIMAVLVATAAVAAPFFVAAALQSVAQRDLAVATAPQRSVSVSRELQYGVDPEGIDRYLSQIRAVAPLRGFTQVGGLRLAGTLDKTVQVATNSALAYRDDLCGYVSVQGTCALGPGGVLVSSRTVARLGVHLGDRVDAVNAGLAKPFPLTIVGVYRPRDPAAPYWAGGWLAGSDADPAYVSRATLLGANPVNLTVTLDLLLQSSALHDATPGVVGAGVAASYRTLSAQGFTVATELVVLTNHIIDDQRLILVAVPLVAGELVLLGWYALFLAVTASGSARRPDVGLLKLRGLPQRRIRTLITAQSALPVLAGAPVGSLLGWGLARWLAGASAPAEGLWTTLAAAAGGLALAVLGAVLAGALAEQATLRSRVVDLLRRIPARRRGMRADVVDLVLLVLAVAGVIQLRVGAQAAPADLGVVAPGLVALAAGLVVARLLVPVSARFALANLRAGRVRSTLVATYLARRPGLDRVLALLVIAATLTGYATLALSTGQAATRQRAAQQTGADRVLSVLADNRTQVLRAVRAADPSGRYAMAAVLSTTLTGQRHILAVDTSRLSTVSSWLSGYGMDPAHLARLLHPTEPAPVTVHSGQLTLDATLTASDGPVLILANLISATGQRLAGTFGPLTLGRHAYTAAVPGCAADGCRLASLQLTTGLASGGIPFGPPLSTVDMILHGLADGGPVVAAGQFADQNRWRATLDPGAAGPILSRAPDGLRVRAPDRDIVPTTHRDGRVYPIDAPAALPMAMAGSVPTDGIAGVPEIDPFGTQPVPVQAVARLAALPRVGDTGLLVDLEYADRSVEDTGAADTMQVWLAPGAPGALVGRLRAAGLSIVGEQRAAAVRAGLSSQGPAVALRFQVVAALLALLLAAGSLVLVSTVDRGARAAELSALRRQGLSARAGRTVVLGGYALLAGVGVLAGGLAALLDRRLAGTGLPLFGDGWRVLSPPSPYGWGALLLAVTGTAVVLGLAALLAAHQLRTRVDRP